MRDVTYRMLTVSQPWADFLVPDDDLADLVRPLHRELADRLPKDVEIRGYGTPWRGTLLVHAGQRLDMDAIAMYGLTRIAERFERGKVVGVVQLRDVVDDAESWWAQPHGARNWQVDQPIRLHRPVACRGFQGLRPPQPAVLAQVLTALAHQRAQAAR